VRRLLIAVVLLACVPAAATAGPDGCLAGHVRRQKDGSLHVDFKGKGRGAEHNADLDEPIAQVHCTAKGRFVIVDHDDRQGPDAQPDILSIIDPVSGTVILEGTGTHWLDYAVNDTYFSPDRRLIAYSTWNGAHGAYSTLTVLRLLDADTDLKPASRADIPIYPTQADLPKDGDVDQWASTWIYRPQPDSPVVWQGPRQLSFRLVDNRLNKDGNPSGAPPIHYKATVTIELLPGKPPITDLTMTKDLP
jgi:hypothetical protein